MTRNARTLYQEMDVLSMSPAKRIAFLYTHLLANLKQARRSLTTGDVEMRSTKLTAAMEIVDELLNVLDREAGGQLADRLAALYVYFIREILQVQLKGDSATLDRVVQMVTSLHEAWHQAAEQADSTVGGVPA